MTRDEHLAWSKRRALEYVDAGDLPMAVTSMTGDLMKHDGFDKQTIAFMAMVGLKDAQQGDPNTTRRWVEGFA